MIQSMVAGMLLKVEPIYKAIKNSKIKIAKQSHYSARKKWNQSLAKI